MVTVVDEELGWGIIEGQYRFRISKFRHLGLCEGDIVNFTAAVASEAINSYGWDVTEITVKERRFKEHNADFQSLSEILEKTADPEASKSPEGTTVSVRDIRLFRSGPTTIKQKYVLCKVAYKSRDEDFFNIFFPPSPSTEQYQVPKKKFGPAQFLLVGMFRSYENIVFVLYELFSSVFIVCAGDWLKLKLERKDDSEEEGSFMFSQWEIKGIEWAEQGFIVGEIMVKGGIHSVQNVYCPEREFSKNGQNLKVGDFCKVKYVLSDQYKTQPEDGEAAYFPRRSCVIEIATPEE